MNGVRTSGVLIAGHRRLRPTRAGIICTAYFACLLLCLGARSDVSRAEPHHQTKAPTRVVSLDYCADQFVLQLADPEQILALSPDATARFSYLRDAAVDLPQVRPRAEDVISLRPDLVVRAYGGGPRMTAFLHRVEIQTAQLPWISSLDGTDGASVTNAISQIARALGQDQKGRALIENFRSRLATLRKPSQATSVLYMSAGGATTGPGSLIHEMLLAAGFQNFESRPGWRPIPLEKLAYEQPPLTAAAFFAQRNDLAMAWSTARHPIARRLRSQSDTVMLDGASTACGGWFIADAIETLAAAAP